MRKKNGKDSVSRHKPSPHQLLNEAPDIIGKMTAVLENGGSLETCIRELAVEGPLNSRPMFTRIVDDADTRIEPNMVQALSRELSELPEKCAAYNMSLRMATSAAGTKDRSEKSRILKEAAEVALNGLRDEGRSFCTSLNTPCMIIFGFGIMVPLVLMSIMPLMGMCGLFGGTTFDSKSLAMITLVLVPSVVLAVILGIRDRNPLKTAAEGDADRSGFLLLTAVIPFFILRSKGFGDAECFCISLIAAGILAMAAGCRGKGRKQANRKTLLSLQECIFELGNRMLSGSPFEDALQECLASKKNTSSLAARFRNELDLSRGDTEKAVRNALGLVSSAITDTYVEIYRVSRKDIRDAGKMAVSLGRQTRDRESLRRNISTELKSMTDTMFGTAAVFAPLVLGLSVALLEPMKGIAGYTADPSTTITLAAYLVELCAMISMLLSNLDGSGSRGDIVRRFCSLVPITMTVFLVTLNVSL